MKRLGIALVLLTSLMAPSFLQAAQTCDRQCLINLMQNYLAALVKHDLTAVPFDKDVKFTENTANIPVGDGFWVTASGGPTEFQIFAADPVMQQVACLVVMKENSFSGSTIETVEDQLHPLPATPLGRRATVARGGRRGRLAPGRRSLGAGHAGRAAGTDRSQPCGSHRRRWHLWHRAGHR